MDENNPSGLVEADWLIDNINNPQIRILDASWHMPNSGRNGSEEYRAAHIPGAQFFDIDQIADTDHEMPHMLPSEDAFSEAISALGIGKDHHVIAYDSLGLFSAARAWWMFRIFGHENVSILNGGLPAWQKLSGPMDDRSVQYDREEFQANLNPDMVRSLGQLKQIVSDGSESILDARAEARFHAQAPEPRAGVRGGHMPGALNLPFDKLLEMDGKRFLPTAKLKTILDPMVSADKPVVTSCGTGITACILALGLELAGYENIAVYDGSWTEWGSQADTPIEAD